MRFNLENLGDLADIQAEVYLLPGLNVDFNIICDLRRKARGGGFDIVGSRRQGGELIIAGAVCIRV